MKPTVEKITPDKAYEYLVGTIEDVVVYTRSQVAEIVIKGWYEIGELIDQYITEYDLNINKFCVTVTQDLYKRIGKVISRSSCYKATQFYRKLKNEGRVLDDVIGEYGSWKRITTKYLPEGGESQAASFSKKQETNDSPLPYLEWLKMQPCCVCGKHPVEPAHYPRTRGAGAKEDEALPMCHECHRVSHDIGFVSFFELYGQNIFENFIYPLIRRCFDAERKQEIHTVLDGTNDSDNRPVDTGSHEVGGESE